MIHIKGQGMRGSKIERGMQTTLERDCIDFSINSTRPDETIPGNLRDEFRRHRLTNIDSIGFRNIQLMKLFIRIRISARDRENKLQK